MSQTNLFTLEGRIAIIKQLGLTGWTAGEYCFGDEQGLPVCDGRLWDKIISLLTQPITDYSGLFVMTLNSDIGSWAPTIQLDGNTRHVRVILARVVPNSPDHDTYEVVRDLFRGDEFSEKEFMEKKGEDHPQFRLIEKGKPQDTPTT